MSGRDLKPGWVFGMTIWGTVIFDSDSDQDRGRNSNEILMEIENQNNIVGKRKEMENTADKDLPFQLTDEEDALFALLMEVVEHFKLQAVLRVAGGWVRDKLMASTF